MLAEDAKILVTYDATHLDSLIESVNEDRNSVISFYDSRSQSDYSVRFERSAFTNDQLKKLKSFVDEVADTFTSYFMIIWQMFFPFLTCEVKCGAAALDIADRQNAHSTIIAVRALVELFKLVEREKEVDRDILAFSISHDHRTVRIYGHYALIDESRTTFYRHSIRTFDFTELDGKERWEIWARKVIGFIMLFQSLTQLILSWNLRDGETQRFHAIFKELQLPRLDILVIGTVDCCEDDLAQLILRHGGTLKEISFETVNINMEHGNWQSLIQKIRDCVAIERLFMDYCLADDMLVYLDDNPKSDSIQAQGDWQTLTRIIENIWIGVTTGPSRRHLVTALPGLSLPHFLPGFRAGARVGAASQSPATSSLHSSDPAATTWSNTGSTDDISGQETEEVDTENAFDPLDAQNRASRSHHRQELNVRQTRHDAASIPNFEPSSYPQTSPPAMSDNVPQLRASSASIMQPSNLHPVNGHGVNLDPDSISGLVTNSTSFTPNV
ncbi:hypothetical protein FQN54_004891 [Arachnomyces sp. PD_36]|nr:hypothetical protein FQN54_004891 [Arachnomyces sp. PD_36]